MAAVKGAIRLLKLRYISICTLCRSPQDGRIREVEKTLADTGAVVELINPKMVAVLDLEIFEMDEEWTLQLADDRLAKVKL